MMWPGAHDEYLVGLADGGVAVRDDETRAALHQLREGALYALLGARSMEGRGFVEDQHRRVREHDAGDAEKLLLALRDVAAVLEMTVS